MNKNPRQIHETVLRDIVDVISGINSETEPLKGIFTNTSYRSIAKGASNLTLVFPVIAEESVTVDAARMCCKAIERKAVVMLQMLFSAINISDSRNAIEYIGQLHKNIELDDELDVNEFIGIMDKISNESSSVTGIEITDPSQFKAVMEDMKNIDYHMNEGVMNPSLSRFGVSQNSYGTPITEARSNEDDQFAAEQDFAAKQQIATDVKKANELVPTLITIKFYANVDGACVPQTAVVGVKAKLQYVSRQDMINRLVIKNKDRNGLFNFLRASTREISFWKDFVFAIDRAKLDALSTSGRGSSDRVWKLLERRAIKSRIKRFTGMMNDASAITTLLISKDTADTLEKEERIRVLKGSNILPIMDAYNVMAFVVVDEVLEKVSFLFDDGSGQYEVMSYAHLEREESGNYKKIINLLATNR